VETQISFLSALAASPPGRPFGHENQGHGPMGPLAMKTRYGRGNNNGHIWLRKST
jgi:hypothetical protein